MDLSRRRLIAWSMAAPSVLSLPAALSGCQPAQTPPFKGIDITGAEYAQDFALPDTEGRQRRLADFKGKVTVVFFGFTQCPDVCPSTLAELAEVRKALGPAGSRVQSVFITVDPERDTPEVLGKYVHSFGADFVALRGTVDETRAVAKHFKVFFAKVPGKTDGSYTMDHTAGNYIFDAEGKIRLFTRYGTGADAIEHDLRLLLAG